MFFCEQRRLRVGGGLLFWVAIWAFAPSVEARTILTRSPMGDTTKVLSIGKVVVYGKRQEVVPAQLLAGEQLRRLNVVSVADALRYFSGVQIKDYGGIGGLKTINVRSMGSHHVGVFFDGIQITNAQNGTVDLGKFSLDNMEAIALYNGQKSELFQSAKDYASSSSLYMVTRRPLFEGGRTDNLTIKLKAGSFDLANASALWERKLSGRLLFSANAELLYTSGRYKFRYKKDDGYDTTEIRRNGDLRSLRAELALFSKVDGGEWMAKAYLYGSRRGYPGAAVKKDYGISLLNEDRQTDRNFFVQSLFRKNFTPLYSLKIQAKYANDYMNYVMPPQTTLEPMDNHYYQQEFYLTATNLFCITPEWSANLATDLQYNRLDATGTDMFNANFVRPRRYTALVAAATSVHIDRFTISGSLLYTYTKDVSARTMAVAPDKSIATPTILVWWQPFQDVNFEVRAFFKKIFRMPTFNDLYYVQIGNRLLKPEYTTQYNLGFVYNKSFDGAPLSSIGVQVDAYRNQVMDKIIATPTSNQLVWTMLNLGFVDIKGADVSITPCFSFGELCVDGRISYTFQQALDLTPEKNNPPSDDSDHTINVYGHQIPYVPRHSGSVVLGLSFRGWDLNYSFIYTGERYMLGGNIPENYIQPWYTHDMSLTKNFKLAKQRMRVTGEVNNIFNQQYEVVKWYPMPGTNFKINVTIMM